jgi:hypothetical protein
MVIEGPGSGDRAWRTPAEAPSALVSRLCAASRLIALTTTLAATQDAHYGPACHEGSRKMSSRQAPPLRAVFVAHCVTGSFVKRKIDATIS